MPLDKFLAPYVEKFKVLQPLLTVFGKYLYKLK